MVNLNKYNEVKFSDDVDLNKKIKALYVLFDNYVDEFKLNYRDKLELIDIWIIIFIKKEEYELAESFKHKKILEWKQYRKTNRSLSFKLIYRFLRLKFKKLY